MFVVLKLLCHIQALVGHIGAVKFKGTCPCCFSAGASIIIVQHAGRTVHTVANTCADVTDNTSVRPTDVIGSESSEQQARPTADSPTTSSAYERQRTRGLQKNQRSILPPRRHSDSDRYLTGLCWPLEKKQQRWHRKTRCCICSPGGKSCPLKLPSLLLPSPLTL